MLSGRLFASCQKTRSSHYPWNQGKNQKQYCGQYQVLEAWRKIPAMPDGQNADVVCRGRSQNNFHDQISLQKSSAKENHCRRDDQPCCGDPLHRINHFVVKRKMIDKQNGDSGPRIEDKRRPARPEIYSNLVDAKREKIRAEQAFCLLLGFVFAFCGRHAGNYCAPPHVCPRLDTC